MRRFLVIAVYIISICSAYGEIIKQVSMQFNIKDFEFKKDTAGNVMILSSVHNLSFDSDTTKPALPFVNCYVLIGDEQEFERVEISSEKGLVLNGVTMGANPTEVPINYIGDAPHINNVKYKDSIYPHGIAEYSGSYYMDGYKIISH